MKFLFNILYLLPILIFSQSESNQNSISKNEELSINLVKKHIKPFNDRNLDLFAKAFDVDVLVSRFPNDTMYLGREKLKENYNAFFEKNKKSNVSVLNRMCIKNMVLDEELATVNLSTNRQITIYKTSNESILSMTFMGNKKTTSNPEAIINKQLEAYNKKDINAFIDTYSKDIKLYMFPDNLISEGHDAMRNQYASMFKKVLDLNAQIVNRMVLGNKVIDKEKVTFNGNTFYAIAIYEVKNEKISKVTFIQ